MGFSFRSISSQLTILLVVLLSSTNFFTSDQAEVVGSRRKAKDIRKSIETPEEKTQLFTRGSIAENETGKESGDSMRIHLMKNIRVWIW